MNELAPGLQHATGRTLPPTTDMLITAHGTPARPELEQHLKQMDPSLGLRWMETAWGVTFRWPEKDVRRQWIREGTCDPEAAFDILCYLPKDCAPHEAQAYVENHCQRWARDMGREDIARLLDHIHEHNAKQTQANMAGTLEYAEELIDANKSVMAEEFGVTIAKPVYQSEPLANQHPGKRKRAKGKDL